MVSERELLLARLLSDSTTRGAVLVLGSHSPTELALRRGFARRIHANVLLATGENTAEEAANAVPHISRDLTLVTSDYHVLRAFLTFVRALEKRRNRDVRLWTAYVSLGVPHLDDEFAKIAQYQATGDVASFAAGLEHLNRRDLGAA